MMEIASWFGGLLLAFGVAVICAIWILSKNRGGRFDQAFSRLEARLDEQGHRSEALTVRLSEASHEQQKAIHSFEQNQLQRFSSFAQKFEQRHTETSATLTTTLQSGIDRLQRQMIEAITQSNGELGKRMEALTASTDKRLSDISGQVDKRLSDGFEKTVATFADVQKRLELIDNAQKKITELSGSVVSLQEILSDRTSRGTFGEVQLQALVANVLPESSYCMQYTLSNGRCVDCMLFLPEPTGSVPIDSKFPLENFRRMHDLDLSKTEQAEAQREFGRNVMVHVQDIANKYIIRGETADCAILFIPAEAVFAEIHGRYSDLVEKAHRMRVLPASPTTLFAILTTAAAVLKDAATREQVNVIQEHLGKLSADFSRFQSRMDNLAQHIDQAHRDVEAVHTSARKISSRFSKIERLDLGQNEESNSLEMQSDKTAKK